MFTILLLIQLRLFDLSLYKQNPKSKHLIPEIVYNGINTVHVKKIIIIITFDESGSLLRCGSSLISKKKKNLHCPCCAKNIGRILEK